MVAELLTVQVAGAQQVAEACVALIVAILGVVADHTADLMGLVVAAEHRTGRNANGTIQHDAMLHQYIQNTGGKHAAHGTAFQHKTRFHICSPLLCAGAQMPDTPYINYSILESVKITKAENKHIYKKPLPPQKEQPSGLSEIKEKYALQTHGHGKDQVGGTAAL